MHQHTSQKFNARLWVVSDEEMITKRQQLSCSPDLNVIFICEETSNRKFTGTTHTLWKPYMKNHRE
jgi:hypothetical protein